jgi:hypothetical protein
MKHRVKIIQRKVDHFIPGIAPVVTGSHVTFRVVESFGDDTFEHPVSFCTWKEAQSLAQFLRSEGVDVRY